MDCALCHVAATWQDVDFDHTLVGTQTCDSCHGFDTLSWREATDAPVSLPHSAEMLPLIVGTPDEPEEPTVDPDEDPDTALDESVIVSEETGRAAQN